MAEPNPTLPILSEQDIARFHTKYIGGLTQDDCWTWIGTRDQRGYGVFKIRVAGAPRMIKAHRLSYLLYKGDDPGKFLVCHRCDNPSCVNPLHFFLGDNAINTADKIQKGRQPKGSAFSHTRLTEADVIEIRALLAAGKIKSQKAKEEAAQRFGITVSSLLATAYRLKWRHVK